MKNNGPHFKVPGNRKIPVPNIEKFLGEDTLKNKWLIGTKLQAYVRKGIHSLNEYGIRTTVDIANIEVKEEYRNQGTFTKWLQTIEHQARLFGYDFIYIENVMSPRFRRFFMNHGYTKINRGEDFSYFKQLERLQVALAVRGGGHRIRLTKDVA